MPCLHARSRQLNWPVAWLAQICQQVPYRIVPERVLSIATSHAISAGFHVLAPRINLLHANEIRYVSFRLVRITRVLGSLEIINGVEYLIAIHTQNVLQKPHIAEVSYLSILLKYFTEPFFTFVRIACHEHFTSRKTSRAVTQGFSLRFSLLVCVEARADPKDSLRKTSNVCDIVTSVKNKTFAVSCKTSAIYDDVANEISRSNHISHYKIQGKILHRIID